MLFDRRVNSCLLLMFWPDRMINLAANATDSSQTMTEDDCSDVVTYLLLIPLLVAGAGRATL